MEIIEIALYATVGFFVGVLCVELALLAVAIVIAAVLLILDAVIVRVFK